MSNKMKKYFLMLLLMAQLAFLHAYDPGRDQFDSNYQYQLYRSWIELSGFKSDTPAAFNNNYVKRIFAWNSDNKVPVYYDWKNHHIYNQREDLSKWTYSHPEEVLLFLGSLLYRLNAADAVYLKDFLDAAQCELILNQSGDGLDFFNIRESRRFYPLQIEVKSSDDGYMLMFYDNDYHFSLLLPENITINEAFYKEEARDFESKYVAEETSAKERVFTQNSFAEKSLSGQRKEAFTTIDNSSNFSSLDKYIKANGEKRFSRELLNNKISDFDRFVRDEYPTYKIEKFEQCYVLDKEVENSVGLGGHHIAFHLQELSDGIMLMPDEGYEMDGEAVKIGGDFYDLSHLEADQQEGIAPYIPQLLYENRVVGSQLINLLFFHDDVATTMICYGDEREKYEFVSYVEMLIMLGKYWDDHDVSFELREFKNVNGFIEFKGFFVAHKDGAEDLVEIWYHLDYDFHLDLIMAIVYPAGYGEGFEEE